MDVPKLDLSEELLEIALEAAKAAIDVRAYYDDAARQWLVQEITAALNAAVGAISASTPIADLAEVYPQMLGDAIDEANKAFEEYQLKPGNRGDLSDAVSHAALMDAGRALIAAAAPAGDGTDAS